MIGALCGTTSSASAQWENLGETLSIFFECMKTGPCALDEGSSCNGAMLPCRPGQSCQDGTCMPPSDWGSFHTLGDIRRSYSPLLETWLSFPTTASTQVLAVHAALLHPGKVLYFAGDEHQRLTNRDDEFATDPLDTVRIFDAEDIDQYRRLRASSIRNPGPPEFLNGDDADAFCAGHAQDPLGRGLYVVGGTESFPSGGAGTHAEHFIGNRFAAVFDAEEEEWINQPSTQYGHWYPTVISYPTDQGDPEGVWTFEGHAASNASDHSAISEVIVAGGGGGWSDAGHIRTHEEGHYPRVFGLPGGYVFSASTSIGQVDPGAAIPFETEDGAVVAGHNHLYAWEAEEDFEIEHTWQSGGEGPGGLYAGASSWWSAVMLPLRPGPYGALTTPVDIMVIGETSARIKNMGWLGLDATQPWRRTGPTRSSRRIYGNSTLLPTGHVFVNGGTSDNDYSDSGGLLTAEIYNPRFETWLVNTDRTNIVRNYHSVSLLLPDGRVWIAGSNPDADNSLPDGSNRELRMEVFEPWYYDHPDRPEITSLSTSSVRPGDFFHLRTLDASRIREVVMMRPGSVTHSFNGDQRLIELTIQTRTWNRVTVQAPFHHNMAPPGHYMVFALVDENDGRGLVPSEAAWIQVSAD